MKRSCRLAGRGSVHLIAVLALSGCSGFGKFWHDTLTLPGANPNAPTGDTENMVRATGGNVQALPILPVGGNIWPGPPQALPSLSDVEGDHGLAAKIGNPATFYGGAELGGAQLEEGGSMSAGEQDGVHHGVRDFSDSGSSTALPNHEEDNAAKYGAKPRAGTITIPNGDGTDTLIAPDGGVRVVHHAPAAPGH